MRAAPAAAPGTWRARAGEVLPHVPPYSSMQQTRAGHTTFCWGERTHVMGVINLTPDSFSGDGLGACPDPDAVTRHAAALVAAGADLLDLGGESTRPGSPSVPESEELARVLPAVRAAVGL